MLFDEIHVKEKGENNHAITGEDQYGRIRVTSVGIGGREGGTQVNSDGCEAEWREDGEMEDGQWTSSEEEDDEWSQEGMVGGGRGEEGDISGGECSVKQEYKGEKEDFSAPRSGERKRQRGALGSLQGAKVSGPWYTHMHTKENVPTCLPQYIARSPYCRLRQRRKDGEKTFKSNSFLSEKNCSTFDKNLIFTTECCTSVCYILCCKISAHL